MKEYKYKDSEDNIDYEDSINKLKNDIYIDLKKLCESYPYYASNYKIIAIFCNILLMNHICEEYDNYNSDVKKIFRKLYISAKIIYDQLMSDVKMPHMITKKAVNELKKFDLYYDIYNINNKINLEELNKISKTDDEKIFVFGG